MNDYEICMYVGYHDANNVPNFGGDSIIWAVEISFVLRCITGTAHHSRDAATGFAAVATRPRAGCWSMEDRRRKSVMSDKSALAIYGNTSLSTVLVPLFLEMLLNFENATSDSYYN